MSQLLSSIGVTCTHEGIFDYAGLETAINRLENPQTIKVSEISSKEFGNWVKSDIEAESSYMAAPYLDAGFLKHTKIIHIVRDPIRVINSFVLGLKYFKSHNPEASHAIKGANYERFIHQHVPAMSIETDPFTRAALYYVKWNELIEQRVRKENYIRIRAEDCPTAFFDYAQINPETYFVNKKANSKLADQAGLDDNIPPGPIKDELIAISLRYGYRRYAVKDKKIF
jgi:hypothetical protein